MNEIAKEKVEKTFTTINDLVYNENINTERLEAQLELDRYLPTNDTAFKKMMASPDNIHISKGFLRDFARNDPLGILQIDTLQIETPYNYKDVNKLKTSYESGILYTEVDFACCDPSGARFAIELQTNNETYLEKRFEYNKSEKYTAMYAGVPKKQIKYHSLRPVIAIAILAKSFYKEDPHPIRYLRPCDTSIDVYKKDLLLGLEICLELDKDVTQQPKYIQDIFQFFRTGEAPADAAGYLKEAASQMEKINNTPKKRELADFYIRVQVKRVSEDDD